MLIDDLEEAATRQILHSSKDPTTHCSQDDCENKVIHIEMYDVAYECDPIKQISKILKI
jgi:hypothetical protein